MKLGVDASWMVGNLRGMGRYAKQLIAPVAPFVFALAPSGLSTTDRPCQSGTGAFFPLWEQVVLPRLCRRIKPDYLLCPYNTGPLVSVNPTRTIAVIHDLIYLQPWTTLPPSVSPYQTLSRIYRRVVVPRFAHRADVILTVSQFTKSELVERLGLNGESIRVIPNSLPDVWFETPPPAISRKPYVFAVAGEQPSKNTHNLPRGFALALRSMGSAARLEIAGIKPRYHKYFAKFAAELGITNNVHLLGYVTDEEMRCWYREARIFVTASLFEVFGIPLVEVLARCSPAACSDATSLPEVAGGCAALFNLHSPEEIAARMVEVWNGGTNTEARTAAGRIRARTFSESEVRRAVVRFWSELQ